MCASLRESPITVPKGVPPFGNLLWPLTGPQSARRGPAAANVPGELCSMSEARTRRRQARAGRLAIRLSADERADFERKAAEAGSSSLAAYLRECVLRSQVVARPAPSADRARLLFLVNKASNNINQLAHQVNTAAKANLITDTTYNDLLGQLADIAATLKVGVGRVD